MSQFKIVSVRYHGNGSAGTGFHAVRFDEGRGKSKRRMVGVVFPERRSVAVLDLDVLFGQEDPHGCGGRKDGPYYEDELREAVLGYEAGRAGGPLDPEEVRDLKYGKHECVREQKSILSALGPCVICGKCKEVHLSCEGSDLARCGAEADQITDDPDLATCEVCPTACEACRGQGHPSDSDAGICSICGGLGTTEPAVCEGCGSTDDMRYVTADKAWYCTDCGHAHLVEPSVCGLLMRTRRGLALRDRLCLLKFGHKGKHKYKKATLKTVEVR